MNLLRLPIVAVQGLRARFTIKMAAPAGGSTSGTVGDTPGAPMRIVVVGDSTAAGCGVDVHDDGFPGCLARELAARTGRRVTWETVGQFGATASRIRHRLLPHVSKDLDLAVLLAGANDVVTLRTTEHWRADLAALLDDLTDRADQVAVVGIPPFAVVPSLPTTLGRYLGERAAALNEVSRQVCAGHPRTTWVSSADNPPPGLLRARRLPSLGLRIPPLGPSGRRPARALSSWPAHCLVRVRDRASGLVSPDGSRHGDLRGRLSSAPSVRRRGRQRLAASLAGARSAHRAPSPGRRRPLDPGGRPDTAPRESDAGSEG